MAKWLYHLIVVFILLMGLNIAYTIPLSKHLIKVKFIPFNKRSSKSKN